MIDSATPTTRLPRPWRCRARRCAGLLLLAAAACASGCAAVAPHQRGRLAHSTMLLTDFSGAAESHIYAIQEGAVGGGSGAEGGCGCN